MTISRSKNKEAYGFHLDKGVPWAYAANGGTISTFVATNANPNNKIGATYRVHKFTSVGAQSIFFDRAGLVDIFIVAGGGQGGGCTAANQGGGGGAGGVIVRYEQYVGEGESKIFVGAGGTSGVVTPSNGQNSFFNQYVALGGGGGAVNWAGDAAKSGGSSGGNGINGRNNLGVPNQGFGGGSSEVNGNVNGGGGGAGEPGGSVNVVTVDRPDGGDGIQIAFENNTLTYYAGGGVGGVRGAYTTPLPTGGLGGGGNLGGTPGTDWNGGAASFYGGGGGGAARPTNSSQQIGGAGYQGIVIIRYIV